MQSFLTPALAGDCLHGRAVDADKRWRNTQLEVCHDLSYTYSSGPVISNEVVGDTRAAPGNAHDPYSVVYVFQRRGQKCHRKGCSAAADAPAMGITAEVCRMVYAPHKRVIREVGRRLNLPRVVKYAAPKIRESEEPRGGTATAY